MGLYLLLAAIVILAISVVLFLKKPNGDFPAEEFALLKKQHSALTISLAKAEEAVSRLSIERDKADKLLQDERIRYDHQISELNKELLTEKNRMAKAEEQFIAQRGRLADQEKSIQEIQQKFQLEFQNVASKLFDEKSQKFTEVNRTNLDILLNPLKQNTAFKLNI